MTEKDLFELKEEIEEAKPLASEYKGEYKSIIKRIKKDWECSGGKELKKLMEKYQEELETLESGISEELENLELDLNGQ